MRTPLEQFFELFGVSKMPWVIRVYILIFVVLCGLLVFSAMKTPSEVKPSGEDLPTRLFSIASDSLKLVLGALLGALSLAAEKQWTPQNRMGKGPAPPSQKAHGT